MAKRSWTSEVRRRLKNLLFWSGRCELFIGKNKLSDDSMLIGDAGWKIVGGVTCKMG